MEKTDRRSFAPLEAIPTGWESDGRHLSRSWTFGSFMDAIGFVNRVAAAAEEADHHPDMDIRWRTVTLTLTTHETGGLTIRDGRLATTCTALAVGCGAQ